MMASAVIEGQWGKEPLAVKLERKQMGRPLVGE